MQKFITIVLCLLAGIGINESTACTSAIISGKRMPDGRPIMWKHRDTSSENNKLLYFSGQKYDYLGMVSVGESENTKIWMGMNSSGFCIMNTASYNINSETVEKVRYGEGRVMFMALNECASLQEFELFLDGLITPTGISSNFGVLDAKGGAAYYEVGHYGWVKTDVNDPKVAPLGYVVRTNFSFSGNPETGQGYARYKAASDIFFESAMQNNLSVETILSLVDRNLVNGFTGDNLTDLATESDEIRMVHFKDNIARKSSTSSAIFKGVKPGDDPHATTMWAVVGWPLASVAVPVWINEKQILPALLTAPTGEHSAICDASLYIKHSAMPITYGHGQDYININRIYNTDNTGAMQWIRPLEDRIIRTVKLHSENWINSIPSCKNIDALYQEIDKMIIYTYNNNNITL